MLNGLFNLIRKKKPKKIEHIETKNDKSVNTEIRNDENEKSVIQKSKLDIASNYLFLGEYQKAIIEVDNILKNNNRKLQLDALKIKGFSFYRMNEFSQSEKIFSEIATETNLPADLGNFAQSLIYNGKVEKGIETFEKALSLIKDDKSKIKTESYLIFDYYSSLIFLKKYEKAFEQFKLLSEVYKSYSITDTMFLMMRNIPTFNTFIDLSLELYKNEKFKIKTEIEFEKIKSKIDKYGKEYIEMKIKNAT